MKIAMAAPVAAFAVILFGVGRVTGQLEDALTPTEFVESACNLTVYLSVRSAWASGDEPCHQKLSMEMWTFMKAKGSAQNADAQLVYAECMREPEMGLVELITPEDWNSDIISAGPGEIVGISEHAATLQCNGAEDFEAICNDDQVTKATRVLATVDSVGHSRTSSRRLKFTTNEAVVAHEVDKLIEGLEDLGCLRTTGEDQTLCVMSDSFDAYGVAYLLQQSGDLPPVKVIKDLVLSSKYLPRDEGAAMIELAFDIASGATYKYNTAYAGEQTFADDIGVLAGAEECDVIVDDITYSDSPSFRDGVVSDAVDAATNDQNVLYFTNAGNDGVGYRAVSEPNWPGTFDSKKCNPYRGMTLFSKEWECQREFFGRDNHIAPCTEGVATHVFRPDSDISVIRYLFPFISSDIGPVLLKWDDDEGEAREMTMIIYEDLNRALSIYAIKTSVDGAATIHMLPPGDNKGTSRRGTFDAACSTALRVLAAKLKGR